MADSMKSKFPPPPKGLRLETRKFWNEIVIDFQLESAHLKILELACKAWDRTMQARADLKRHGLTFKDEHGIVRPHPAVIIERNSSILFARLLRELRLGDEAPPSDGRVPRVETGATRRFK